MSIDATLVGSYPVPDWLRSQPSRQGLEDATRVVLAIQSHGFWMLARSIADGKIRSLVAGRDLYAGHASSGPS